MERSVEKTFRKVQRFIEQHTMLDKARGVVLAVSGGKDSVALVDLFLRLRQARQKTGAEALGKLHIAHLNHLLRGREAAADADFVRHLARETGLSCTTQERDVRRYAEASGKGIEEAARELRYEFLLAVAREQDCDRIATGHSMTDQAETVLMRLLRGSGLRGLAAMRPVTRAHIFPAMQNEAANTEEVLTLSPSHPLTLSPLLIRPLLCLTREEIEDYCGERGLAFREDSSNVSLNYTRNRLRHETLPALRAQEPRIVERLAHTAALVASEEEALREIARRSLDEAKAPASAWQGQGRETRQRSAYALAAFLKQPEAVLRRMLIEAIRRARESARAGGKKKKQIVAAHIRAIERLLRDGASGDRVVLPQALEVWREFDQLVFLIGEETGKGMAGDAYCRVLNRAHGHVQAGGLLISISRQQPIACKREIVAQTEAEKNNLGVNWKQVALDDAALPEDLLVRPRRQGDLALIVQRRKRIKLKKLMIDHKIASSRRASHPVVTTLDGEYVWSPGLPPALRFAAHDKSTSLAILRATPV